MSISISISRNRTSAVAPASLHLDATATTTTQSSTPFHDTLAIWDGDDPTTNFSYGSTLMMSKNAGRGLVWGHIYESAGSYEPFVTVFDGVSIAQLATTFTVQTDAAAGISIYAFSTSDTFTGAPAGATQVDVATAGTDLGTIISTYAAQNRRLVFRGGEAWSESTAIVINLAGPIRIGGYSGFGTGNPDFSSTVSGKLFQIDNTRSDIAFNDIDFDAADTAGSRFAGQQSDSETTANITLLRIICTNASSIATVESNNANADGWFVHECELSGGPVAATNGLRLDGTRCSVQGNKIDNNLCTESPVRNGFAKLYIFSHNEISGNEGGHELVAYRNRQDLAGEPSKWIIHSFNKHVMLSSAANASLNIGPSNTTTEAIFEDVIIEGNWFKLFDIAILGITRGSIRNNLFDQTGNTAVINRMVAFTAIGTNITGPNESVKVLFNTLYNGGGTVHANCYLVHFQGLAADAVDSVVTNNLGYSPNSTSFAVTTGSSTNTTVGSNSTTAEMDATDPGPTWSATPSTMSDLQISSGSYAIGDGTDGISVFEDARGAIRDYVTPDNDLGFWAFTTSSLPATSYACPWVYV